MEINFKANLINTTHVRKLNPITKQFTPHKVSFVEINSKSRRDIKTLKKLAKAWGEKSYYAEAIYLITKTFPSFRTYLLTEQDADFKNIDHKKVLGITQLSQISKDHLCIDYLETKPEYQKTNPNREYKKIGSEILHSLKRIFINKTLEVDYILEEVDFYQNNGFYFNDPISMNLIWNFKKEKKDL